MTRTIPLTKGLIALVDDEDYDRVTAAGSWCASITPRGAYALRGVPKPGGGRTTIRLHNFITGCPFVDHINGDGLDNRRANLRPASQSTNGRNVGAKSTNTSGFKGVTWNRRAGRWRAQITTDGHNRSLGDFADIHDAARAYDTAALKLHGEFACTNYPREDHAA